MLYLISSDLLRALLNLNARNQLAPIFHGLVQPFPPWMACILSTSMKIEISHMRMFLNGSSDS